MYFWRVENLHAFISQPTNFECLNLWTRIEKVRTTVPASKYLAQLITVDNVVVYGWTHGVLYWYEIKGAWRQITTFNKMTTNVTAMYSNNIDKGIKLPQNPWGEVVSGNDCFVQLMKQGGRVNGMSI